MKPYDENEMKTLSFNSQYTNYKREEAYNLTTCTHVRTLWNQDIQPLSTGVHHASFSRVQNLTLNSKIRRSCHLSLTKENSGAVSHGTACSAAQDRPIKSGRIREPRIYNQIVRSEKDKPFRSDRTVRILRYTLCRATQDPDPTKERWKEDGVTKETKRDESGRCIGRRADGTPSVCSKKPQTRDKGGKVRTEKKGKGRWAVGPRWRLNGEIGGGLVGDRNDGQVTSRLVGALGPTVE